jgi:hypothetical protein
MRVVGIAVKKSTSRKTVEFKEAIAWEKPRGKDAINFTDEEDNDALIQLLDFHGESWILDLGASFHSTSR